MFQIGVNLYVEITLKEREEFFLSTIAGQEVSKKESSQSFANSIRMPFWYGSTSSKGIRGHKVYKNTLNIDPMHGGGRQSAQPCKAALALDIWTVMLDSRHI